MRQVKITCDICGNLITTDFRQYELDYRESPIGGDDKSLSSRSIPGMGTVVTVANFSEYDVCNECFVKEIIISTRDRLK